MATAATIPPSRREPIRIACGDSINFQRNFPKYPAPIWVIEYAIRGSGAPINFNSAQPPAGGVEQLVFVDGGTTEGWPPGDFEMEGFAANTANVGERYQVYLGPVEITPDLATAPGDQSTQTFAQQMVAKLEAVMLGRANNDVLDSEINGTMIRRIPVDQLTTLYFRFRHQRQGEIANERARNKRPTGRSISTQVAVMFPNPTPGENGYGPGSIYRGGL